LSVCRRLVTLMQGTIALDSAPGRGTSVVVTVPLLRPAGTGLAAGSVVLVCDDDPVSRLLMAEILATRGLQVVQVGDAAAALSRWRQGDVRLLVTDLTMPGESGEALVASLRAEEAAQGRRERTAVVVCSGNPAPTQSSPSSCDAFIAKPVDIETLFDTLEALGLQPAAA
jgi:two-component system sensor histidine kinase EvgS